MPYNLNLEKVGEVGNLGWGRGCCMGKFNQRMYVHNCMLETFSQTCYFKVVDSIVIIGYTVFYVFNTFSIERHVFFPDINNTKRKASYIHVFPHM